MSFQWKHDEKELNFPTDLQRQYPQALEISGNLARDMNKGK